MSSHKIIRVTETEFEMEDGTVYPMVFELDEIPPLEEFQKIYDEWVDMFTNKKLLNEHEKTS